jgi:hypothetical protein
MIDTNTQHSWSTADEVEYLEALGTHSVLGRSSLSRVELLQAYQRCLSYRPRSEKYLDFDRLDERVKELINADSNLQEPTSN